MTQMHMMGEISAFRFWCQKVLPAVYDDSLSYYELLCKVIAKLNEMIEQSNGLLESVQPLVDELMTLREEFEKFKESGFEDYYKAQLDAWVNKNMPGLIGQGMKMVFFGLTLDGHFVAYIPDSWKEIVFDTGAVYGTTKYGRLILKYDVDSPYTVEQPNNNISDDEYASLSERVGQLSLDVNKLNRTAYTPISQDDRIG